MSTSYAIDPDVAKRATQDYLAIKQAGMVPELESEVRLTIESHRAQQFIGNPPHTRINHEYEQLDKFRNGGGWFVRGIETDAEHLASLLECQPDDAMPFVFDAQYVGPTTRGIVLQCLRDVANQARRKLTARGQQAGRVRS